MSTAKRSPPFRAEHVGSLLRPDELVQKRYAVAEGKAKPEELKPIEDKAVTEVVKLQKECGFHAVSSGEYTRYVFPIYRVSIGTISSISLRERKASRKTEGLLSKNKYPMVFKLVEHRLTKCNLPDTCSGAPSLKSSTA